MRNPPQTAARRLSGGARGVVVESWPSRPGTRCVWLVVRARRTWRGPTTSTTPSAAPQRDSTPPLPVASAPTTPASDATSPRTGADRPRGEDRADFVVPWWRSRPRKPLSRSYLRPRGRGLRVRTRDLPYEHEALAQGELGGRDSTSAPSLDPLLPRVGLLHEDRDPLAKGCAYCTKTHLPAVPPTLLQQHPTLVQYTQNATEVSMNDHARPG